MTQSSGHTSHTLRLSYGYSTVLSHSFADFDKDHIADKIHFIIKRVKVHSDSTVPGYKYPSNYGVEKYLEIFSEDNFDDFCLAYMFTHRDFEGGTLGLAWTGDLQNAGGVCEKNGVSIVFYTVQTFNSRIISPDVCQCLVVQTPMKNKLSTSMTHFTCEVLL